MSETKLLAGPNAPNVKTFKVHVPAGHALPGGVTVKDAFDVTVVAGARWHPDWDAPRYSVMAYRMLPEGDAVGFSGERAMVFPLPEWARQIAGAHGETALPGAEIMEVRESDGEFVGMGVFTPFRRERLADFILPVVAHRLN